jgi:hypothetical protein
MDARSVAVRVRVLVPVRVRVAVGFTVGVVEAGDVVRLMVEIIMIRRFMTKILVFVLCPIVSPFCLPEYDVTSRSYRVEIRYIGTAIKG